MEIEHRVQRLEKGGQAACHSCPPAAHACSPCLSPAKTSLPHSHVYKTCLSPVLKMPAEGEV